MKLSDIQAAADKEYAPVELDLSDRTIELRTPLRLSKAERKKLSAALSAEDAEDPIDTLEEAFRILASNKADGNQLIKELNGDLVVAIRLFKDYTEESQLGEALSSDD